MTKITILATAVLALTLAACSDKSAGPAADASSEPVAVEAAEPADLPPQTAAASDPARDEAPVATTIPTALRGRWGLVPADCTSTAGDAKGLLTIGADQLKFYESVAKLQSVTSATTDAVTGTYSFSGEGQSWTLQVALSSSDGGKTLVRKDTGPDAAPQPLTYMKCR